MYPNAIILLLFASVTSLILHYLELPRGVVVAPTAAIVLIVALGGLIRFLKD